MIYARQGKHAESRDWFYRNANQNKVKLVLISAVAYVLALYLQVQSINYASLCIAYLFEELGEICDMNPLFSGNQDIWHRLSRQSQQGTQIWRSHFEVIASTADRNGNAALSALVTLPNHEKPLDLSLVDNMQMGYDRRNGISFPSTFQSVAFRGLNILDLNRYEWKRFEPFLHEHENRRRGGNTSPWGVPGTTWPAAGVTARRLWLSRSEFSSRCLLMVLPPTCSCYS